MKKTLFISVITSIVITAIILVAFFVFNTKADAKTPDETNKIDVPAKFLEAIKNNDLTRLRQCLSIVKLPFAYDPKVSSAVYEFLFYPTGYLFEFGNDIADYNVVDASYSFECKAINLGLIKFSFTLQKGSKQQTVSVLMNVILIDDAWYLHVDVSDSINNMKKMFNDILYKFGYAFTKKIEISDDMMNFMMMLNGTVERAKKAIKKYVLNDSVKLDGLDELPLREAFVAESNNEVYVVDFVVDFNKFVRYEITWEKGKITSVKKLDRK